ncbi:GNAT family N-acetyltransferase [Pontivivens insulae]|uniref:Acetyltransferase YpeA n=1 Tax=Pontivivens insulae TaxID=1639689 RepID=A0A2R8A9A2_9RHOB|nr:GNAT family N-acetyltransferase [Pontivivens insulae]RED18815.1 L-amino acid N-acyltransferase YncA [Pontivivens insulae]SPF28715.1 Acetyltransferase YpeA [Pontivivens insulae]
MIPTGLMEKFQITRLGAQDDAEIAAFAASLEEEQRAPFLPEVIERHRIAIAEENRVVSLVRDVELVAIVIEQGTRVAVPIPYPTVHVRGTRRREGIGTALIKRILEAARDAGCEAIAASVAAKDTTLANCLTRLGFRHTETLLKMETPLISVETGLDSLVDIQAWDASKSDWSEQISNLYNVHFSTRGNIPSITAEKMICAAKEAGARFLVALDRKTERLVGYADWYDGGMVNSIVVRKRWGGRGVAEALVNRVKHDVGASGGEKLTSFVSTRNAASIRLHRVAGAVEVDQLHTYKHALRPVA